MRYCEPVITGFGGLIRTQFYCDWQDRLYSSASECFKGCSPLLISKSDTNFIILLIVSLFILLLISWVAKSVLE